MKKISSLWPVAVFLLLQPDRVLLYRYGYTPWNRGKLLDRKTYLLDEEDGPAEEALARTLTRITAEFRPGADDSWYLGLPLRYFTFVEFNLPQAAADNLDQAVHYALMRHVPFDLESTHVRHDSQPAGEQLLVSATVVPKDELSPLLEDAASAGIAVSAVLPSLALVARLHEENGFYISGGETETEVLGWKDGRIIFSAWDLAQRPEAGATFLARTRPAMVNAPLPGECCHFLWEQEIEVREAASALSLAPEALAVLDQLPKNPGRALADFPYQIGLVPESVLRRRRISFWVQAAALLLVLLAVLSIPLAHLAGLNAKLDRLDAMITEISATTDELTRMRTENERIVTELRRLASAQGNAPVPAEVLRELTEILPPDVWLTTLVMDRERVELRGTAASATTVIEQVEASPLFKEARFDSPVTKRGDKELFKVLAGLERQPVQGG
ncbi:PilN domain-containing protein [Desulfocurvibacter africanus]|uniref:Fimbrial assembly family protein n=1 Tax=Desulfocurvibacter africanus subsp. africanus str. Walvis Bay TaxID=690850 RepID=F3YVH4_DESAF|nr:PilN domain-containing protein [Desulfocurvibacter africanus]EGJ48566.1 Fimbrial assembly family protein [Desulfocurvibacter africanus subsp. africanus str. Walvis Bay]